MYKLRTCPGVGLTCCENCTCYIRAALVVERNNVWKLWLHLDWSFQMNKLSRHQLTKVEIFSKRKHCETNLLFHYIFNVSTSDWQFPLASVSPGNWSIVMVTLPLLPAAGGVITVKTNKSHARGANLKTVDNRVDWNGELLHLVSPVLLEGLTWSGAMLTDVSGRPRRGVFSHYLARQCSLDCPHWRRYDQSLPSRRQWSW